jgi:dipeptidase
MFYNQIRLIMYEFPNMDYLSSELVKTQTENLKKLNNGQLNLLTIN